MPYLDKSRDDRFLTHYTASTANRCNKIESDRFSLQSDQGLQKTVVPWGSSSVLLIIPRVYTNISSLSDIKELQQAFFHQLMTYTRTPGRLGPEFFCSN